MSTPESVIKQMTIVSANYPNYKLTKEAVTLYGKVLSDIPDDAMEAAAVAICSRPGQFYPTAGDWRDKALDIMLAKKDLPSAYEAWECLLSMGDGEPIKHVTGEKDEQGRWLIEVTPREWKHPHIETAARQCGWPNFPDPESLSYDRDTFIKAYTDLCRRENDAMRTPELVRAVEQKYMTAGTQIRALAEGMKHV